MKKWKYTQQVTIFVSVWWYALAQLSTNTYAGVRNGRERVFEKTLSSLRISYLGSSAIEFKRK